MEETKLSSSYSVKDYRRLKTTSNTQEIATLIKERFRERYIEPFKSNPSKNGFAMMAVSCLMLEAMHAFRNGWRRTSKAGGEVFEDFFCNSAPFLPLRGRGSDFYSSVRCGILHQAETYGGWIISRKGNLFDSHRKVINATKFLDGIESELESYVSELGRSPFNSKIWRKAIKKLDYICDHCR